VCDLSFALIKFSARSFLATSLFRILKSNKELESFFHLLEICDVFPWLSRWQTVTVVTSEIYSK